MWTWTCIYKHKHNHIWYVYIYNYIYISYHISYISSYISSYIHQYYIVLNIYTVYIYIWNMTPVLSVRGMIPPGIFGDRSRHRVVVFERCPELDGSCGNGWRFWMIGIPNIIGVVYRKNHGKTMVITWYGYGSIPIKIPFLMGWPSINPSYFDVNRRGTIGFDTLPYEVKWRIRHSNGLKSGDVAMIYLSWAGYGWIDPD